MIPYKANLATAVPKAPGVRLAIIGAIGRLGEQCDNERRAEIACLRHELEDIAQDLCRVGPDAPDSGWIPGVQYAADGHHWVPKGIYEKEPLMPEVRRVFENAKSGPLADNGVNRWNAEHRSYNDALQEDFNAFLQRNKITSQQMTPDQAQQFVDEVLTSADPRIRVLKMKVMHQMLRYFLLRGPRGGDEE